MSEYLVALVLPPVLLLGWVFVQNAWRRLFGTAQGDEDVLAARGGCGSCDCSGTCERNND